MRGRIVWGCGSAGSRREAGGDPIGKTPAVGKPQSPAAASTATDDVL
jgi:hypothetical protein